MSQKKTGLEVSKILLKICDITRRNDINNVRLCITQFKTVKESGKNITKNNFKKVYSNHIFFTKITHLGQHKRKINT